MLWENVAHCGEKWDAGAVMNRMDLQSASPCECDRRAHQETNPGAAVTITGALPIPFPDALDGRTPFSKSSLSSSRAAFIRKFETAAFLT
jgi:hypothetical protein